MKNNIIAICSIVLVILLTTVMSCKRNDDVYSCNETVNQKVKKNRDANQNISRFDLAHLDDLDYQMGVFVSLSPENKVRIFREKIAAEQSNINLSYDEKQILNNLIDYLKPEHYTSLNAEFQQFANSKETILRNTYGWDDAKVYIFTNSWMLDSEIADYIHTKMLAPGTGGNHGGGGNGGGGLKNPCNCYYGYYCWIKGGGSGSCITGECNKPKGGCGVFGFTNCDGKCL